MPAVLQRKLDQKRVSISSKRQFTIPQKYYIELGFRNEAICTLGDGILIIQPVESIPGGEFSKQILSELIDEGFSGQELLIEFIKRRKHTFLSSVWSTTTFSTRNRSNGTISPLAFHCG